MPLPTLQLAEIDGFIALSFAADSEGVRNCNAIVIDHHLKLGKTVVVNGSRAHLVTALSRYPAMTVVLITLPREVEQARLTTRAREDAAAIAARLARTPDIAVPATQLVTIDNSDPLDHATQALTQVLLGDGV